MGRVPEVLFQHQREGKPFSDERVEVVGCDWDVVPGEGFMNSGPANNLQPQTIQEHGHQGIANHIVVLGDIDAFFGCHLDHSPTLSNKLDP